VAGGSRAVERWRRAVAPHARPAPSPDPRESALLVIDMQRHFASLCGPIVGRVARAAAACRSVAVPVFFTQHGHADPAVDGGMLGRWWGELIVEGTDDHELLPELGIRDEDTIVPKRRYSAFHETDLDGLLRRCGVRDLAIAGVMTNLCVETSARDAFVRDYQVRVLMDATATVTDAMQEASLVNLAYGFAHVQTVDEWLHAWGISTESADR